MRQLFAQIQHVFLPTPYILSVMGRFSTFSVDSQHMHCDSSQLRGRRPEHACLFFTMPRLLLLVPLLLAAFTVTATAQPSRYPSATSLGGQPKSGFTAAIRMIGGASVTFRNVGTISSPNNIGDEVSEVSRNYDDGNVIRDARTTDDGLDIPDDGKTNTWNYNYSNQVTADGSAIAFHNYSTLNNGSTVAADSPKTIGVDLEASLRFGGAGKSTKFRFTTISWGGMAGFAFNSINANSRSKVTANLRTVTDIYSLDGATAPTAPYTAPSTNPVTSTNPDGSTTTNNLDTTTFLANRPSYARTTTTTVNGAELDGYWQVKGAFATVRVGPWVRWQPASRFSFRASAGVTFTVLGVQMRYDELYKRDDMVSALQETNESKSIPFSTTGVFGSLDAEFWMTDRTGIFAGAVYEKVSKNAQLSAGGRTADIKISNGTGFRFGITTRF